MKIWHKIIKIYRNNYMKLIRMKVYIKKMKV